ncbi:MAG TPA: hypothetical protein VLJ37_01115 [bacterium]|nr:hypothetical protein [bacterium]
MKGTRLAALAGAIALLVSANSQALDLGSKVGNATKEAAHAGGKMAVEKEINKNLAEKNCSFKPKTTDLSCDLQEILKTLKDQKTIAEKSGFANDVDIFVKIGQGKDAKNPSLGSDRNSKVRTELIKKVSWWDWYDTSIDGDQLELSVKIR